MGVLLYRKGKPPYWKDPIIYCDLCGTSLLGRPRYRVKLYLRSMDSIPFKTLHLCEDCLRRVRENKEYRKRFLIRYRKMPTLGLRHNP